MGKTGIAIVEFVDKHFFTLRCSTYVDLLASLCRIWFT